MRASQAQLQKPKKRWIGWLAAGLSVALVTTFAVISDGFDSRETPREEPSVWVERSAGQYARVNTETAEIDTVRVAENSSGVVQTGALGLLLTQGYGRAWVIDPASPQDIVEDAAEAEPEAEATAEATAEEAPEVAPVAVVEQPADAAGAMRTPEGTRQVIAAGNAVLFFTESGQAYLSRVSAGGAPGDEATSPALLDPLANERSDSPEAEEAGEAEETERYRATAAALDESGRVALFSAAERTVRWFDSTAGQWHRSTSGVPEGVPAEGVQLAIIGGSWAILHPESGRLWLEQSGGEIELALEGNALLQGSSATGSAVLIADEAGLWQADRSGNIERIVSTSGLPAQPRPVGAEMIAAWLGSSAGLLWSEQGGEVPLELDESIDELTSVEPEIRANGSRALVMDRRTGMMWTAPEGKLIPLEQWALIDPPKQDTGVVITQDVTEQEPPVAVADAFGVRAGEAALLPVLLNDYDPNRKDVLTIVPDGLGEGLPAEFGTVSMLSDGQALTMQPSGAAEGSATFSYRITDGVNVSAPATVTLTVVGDEINTAPEWCPVDGCQRSWPSPELAPGGTLILPILEGWVDPEGDVMMLVSATPMNAEDPVHALVTAEGKLAVRHTDPNADSADIGIQLGVVDARGGETTRELRLRVRSGAAMEFSPIAATAKLSEATVVHPLERVSGGSGSFQLVDALVQQGSAALTVNPGRGTIEVLAGEVGNSIVSVTVRDAITEQEVVGALRVTAVEARASFGVPPLRAFVRPLADTTVDVLAAIPGANSRALTVQSVAVQRGQLRADVIEHSRVRVSGSTPSGQPGRIGTVEVAVAEGASVATGHMTVFQVAESAGGAIAVTDTATVRAGSVVDIPVLANDVAPPGERLVLHPEVGAPGLEGELAFASGSNVRYLAPKLPGTYMLSYTTYGASHPESSDVGQVRVTVLPEGSNRDPQPAMITVRVAPGEQARVTVPLSGVDPDGDRIRLVAIDAPEDPRITASLLSRSNAVQVEASSNAQQSTQLVNYLVRDGFGGEAQGKLRIIVTAPDPSGDAPVVYSDYVRIQRGIEAAAAVRPLDNDIDPSGGTLELVSVEPNVPGGAGTALWTELESRLDLAALDEGIVRIEGGDLGTVSYKYTVRSSKSKSTADGLIVVQVSERVGLQAPAVSDTVLSVRDRSELTQSGVDVVTDRVRWAGGDISTLQLSLWGSAQGNYTVSGSRISGAYRAAGDLVPFKLTGVDGTGAEVETFGFMIVPPLDELRLTLRPGVAALTVNEDKSVDADVAEMLDLGPGDRVELDEGSFAVQREQASCTSIGATTIRYAANKEAPFNDTCTVRVRLTEQNTYTSLPIAINIVPNAPVVQLNPLTRTIAPGAEETINLADMVQWQGGREGDMGKLRWQVSGGGGGFEATPSGASVRAVARADAVPGSQIGLSVVVSGAGDAQAQLTLRVGNAPADNPRGGTVSLQCTVGSSCSTSLIGISGEHDPFKGRSGGGLQLVSVDGGSCSYGTLSAAGNSVQVNWPDSRGPGGRCTASFTVRDAQNRTGAGTIELDAQGVPRAPSSIALAAYDESSVTLEVRLGGASSAHPAVTGVVVNQNGGGAVGSCSPSGASYRCVVGGLRVGERHSFSARAVNSVGESDSSNNSAEGWAYRLPRLSSEQIVIAQESAQSPQTGTVAVSIAASDETVGSIRVTGGGANRTISGSGGSVTLSGVATGENVEFTAVPVSQFAPPIAGLGTDGVAASKGARIIGTPTISDFAWESADGSDSGTAAFAVDGAFEQESRIEWGVVTRGSCSYTGNGSSASENVSFARPFAEHQITLCAKNSMGEVTSTETVWVGGNPPALEVSEGYTIGAAPSSNGNTRSWVTVSEQPTFGNLVSGATLEFSNGSTGTLESVAVGANVSVRQCIGGKCSDSVSVPVSGDPASSVTKSSWACIPHDVSDAALPDYFSVSGRGDAPSWRIDGKHVYVGWAGWNEAFFESAICDDPPPPEPEPEPEPDPTDPLPDPPETP